MYNYYNIGAFLIQSVDHTLNGAIEYTCERGETALIQYNITSTQNNSIASSEYFSLSLIKLTLNL